VTERLYAESARDLNAGKLSTAREIAERFAQRVPTDGDFLTVFSTHTVRHGWPTRYYLSRSRTLQRARHSPSSSLMRIVPR
jgi:hypothetical protein